MIFFNRNRIKGDQRGFTLVEIIVVLLLSSILAATTGLILATFVKSYVLSRQSADLTQKAQLTLKRLKIEFEHLSDVHTATSTSLYYKVKNDSGVESIRVAGLDGSTVKLGDSLPAASGRILLDQVQNFTLSYFDENGNLTGTTNWSSSGSWNSPSFTSLYAIRIDFSLDHESGPIPFSTTIYPSFRTSRIPGPLNWNSQ